MTFDNATIANYGGTTMRHDGCDCCDVSFVVMVDANVTNTELVALHWTSCVATRDAAL